MKEFRYIFKVDHTDPEGTLKHVGEMVAGEPAAFQSVDINFVNEQDFITAVPIEIALTMDMRARVLYQNPSCKFVITGVPVFKVASLVEYGYQVVAGNIQQPEDGTLKCADKKEEVQEKEEPQDEAKKEARYWVDKKEVTKEEFLEEVKKMKNSLKDDGLFGKLFNIALL